MNHNIKAFDPYNWQDSRFDFADYLFFYFVGTILGLFAGAIVSTTAGAVGGWIAFSCVAVVIPSMLSLAIRTHRNNKFDSNQMFLVKRIDALPAEYQAEFGDYENRIVAMSDLSDIESAVFRVERAHEEYIRVRDTYEGSGFTQAADRIVESLKSSTLAMKELDS